MPQLVALGLLLRAVGQYQLKQRGLSQRSWISPVPERELRKFTFILSQALLIERRPIASNEEFIPKFFSKDDLLC